MECRSAGPRERRYRIADSGSLFLAVHPSGHKSWEYRYRHDGKTGVVVGEYPEISLRAARQARDKLKAMLADGLDPAKQKQIAKHE